MTVSGKKWVYYLGDPLADEVEDAAGLLGGKGAGLNEMSLAGLRVPPGFVISTECCEHFFGHGESWPTELEGQLRESLARLERDTGRAFGRGAGPLLVSVRSGAAVSMPGMMDTLLNCGLHPGLADEVADPAHFRRLYVQFIEMLARSVAGTGPKAFDSALGRPDGEMPQDAVERCIAVYEDSTGRAFPRDPWQALVECINAVFRSWRNERAVAYRRRHGIRGLKGTAVTVQAMFPSRVSGILFTQDPNNLDADHMIVEASYGLGEAVVSGDVTPDRYVVSRDHLACVETALGHKVDAVRALGDESDHDPGRLSLTPERVRELCRLALRVEEHFGRPMDIEWGWAGDGFALLQSRAIRGLDVAADVEMGRRAEIERLRVLAGGRRRVWVVHNLSETLAAPTPLTWDVTRRFMSGSGGFGLMYRDFGYRPSQRVCDDGFLELICGRIYADPERLAQLFWGDTPLTYDLDAILEDRRCSAARGRRDVRGQGRARTSSAARCRPTWTTWQRSGGGT